MRPELDPRWRLSRLAPYLCAALVVATPLVRGGVDLPTEVVVLVFAAVAAASASSTRPLVSYATLALGGVVLWMMIQLLPVPAAAHVVSPGAVAIFDLSLAELGRYPATRAIALDVASGHREVAKATACLLVVFASAACADSGWRQRLMQALAASAVAVAGAALGSALLGFTPVLVPSIPFVNPNHLAGFFNLTGFVALGQAMQAKGAARTIWAIGSSAVFVVTLASISRAGILVFAFGALVFSIWGWRRRLVATRTHALLLSGAIVVGTAGGALLALTPVLEQMSELRASPTSLKMDLWPLGLRLVREYALVGIGRGAFSTVFQAYRTDLAAVTYTHLENEWFQVLIDLGIPFGLLLLGTIAWVWVRAARRAASLPELGLLVGVVCLGVQCWFDFSVETMGVAVPLSVALGVLVSGTGRVRVPVATLVAVVALLAGVGIARQVGAGRADARLASLGTEPLNEIARAGARVVSERPADYLPHALVGVRLAQEGRCREAMPWLRRAMLLAPMVPEPHASAGRCLAGVHDQEAIREYGLAVSLGHGRALAEAIRAWPSLDVLYRIAGDTPGGLLALANALSAERAHDAQLVLTRLWEEFTDNRAVLPLARVALRNGDLDTAVRAARQRLAAAPSDLEAYRIAGSALASRGDIAAAREELERGLAVVPGAVRLIDLQVAWDIKERRFGDARRRTNRIVPRTPSDIAARHVLRATILSAQSRAPEALLELEGALVATPDDPWLWMYVAQLRSSVGRAQEAIAALERAAALPGSPKDEIATRLDELRRTPPPGPERSGASP
ncbi:MAG TPA: O-antigen ligase family protein [Gemmatimonadaceae bacterium]|nr:O-antigen ligase family protein [Gemmatimonadaceae bacterium]